MKPGAPKGQKIFKNKIKKTQNGHFKFFDWSGTSMKPGAPKGQKIFKNKIKKTQNGRSVSDYC
tara:strand:+ start:363 stop:551 length:189 start_codon:yes stop_codon:yes gene_type:complete